MAIKSASRTQSKPYDRPAPSARSKGKQRAAVQDVGAPSTHSQSSRKGKKAWRKNIDIRHEEQALEEAREEERVTGGTAVTKSNNELFTVDVVGDTTVAAKAKRQHKPLRSLAILSERSAIPSLNSRATPLPARKQALVNHAERERLRKIARKTQAYHDGTGLSSADIKANGPVVQDAWVEEKDVAVKGGFAEETIVKRKVKVPVTIQRQRESYLSSAPLSIEKPTAGVSYNPSVESHSNLINAAYEEELGRLKKEEVEAALIAKYGSVMEARKLLGGGVMEGADGMTIGGGESDSEDETDSEERVKKPTKRKTTAQRNRQARQKALEAALEVKKQKRLLASSVSSLSIFKRELELKQAEQMEKEKIAKLARLEKEKSAKKEGQKVGKYRVGKQGVQVQLGEDLAETLRQVKPEGNLFKDRFLALQKRALIEPRVPVLPKRKNKTKEYEKHAYKRFQ